MKILGYIHNKEIPTSASPSGITPREKQSVYAWADSNWLLSNRPLFIPDFADNFIAIPSLAVKAGKLGKAIPLRFTPRYFKEWASTLLLMPEETAAKVRQGLPVDTLSLCFDNSVVIGDWIEIPSVADPIPNSENLSSVYPRLLPDSLWVKRQDIAESPERLSENKEEVFPVSFPTNEFPQAFNYISGYNIIKTGDLIIIPSEKNIPVKPGINITVSKSSDFQNNLLFTRFK